MLLRTEHAVFAQLLISGALVHEGTFEAMCEMLEVQINPNLVFIVSIDRYPELAAGMTVDWRIDIGQKLVEAVHKAISEPFLWIWTEQGILAVLIELPNSGSHEPQLYKRPLSIVKKIQELTDAQGFSVSAGIGPGYESPYLLYRSYEEAKQSMEDRFFQGNRIIYQYEQEKRQVRELKKPVAAEEKIELLARVRIGDVEGSVSYLKVILERIATTYKFHVDMFKSEVIDLIMSLSRMVLDMGGDGAVILSENARMIQSLIGTVRYDNFVNKLCDYWRNIARHAGQVNQFEGSPIIGTAIKYMKNHHQEKVSLKGIAEYCHVNPYYLAHLFKRETGMSCFEFLTKLRIEKSLYLLDNTDMTVQNIAVQVGFPDANYFSRKFKIIMDCSPSGYREAKLC
ncbi:helix-turn-helix domain-containing protein [Cohnella sp.]|uniref:helix-turn-helix domain-containing protein n=1 Tax=Cohnella sp. TaxID=1883426 RepID=UPI003561CBAB